MTQRSVGQHNQADITAVMGAPGSGKSLFLKAELKRLKPARLMVWDYKREYAEHGQLAASMAEVLQLARKPSFKIIYQPSHDPATGRSQFDVFCRIAYAAKRLTLLAEELAFVTSASYAPPGWAMVTLAGRSEGLIIYGASQRPAAIDKNFFGSASRIRTGRLNFKRDIEVLADVLQVTRDKVASLAPLQWIERDMNTGKTATGTQKIPR